MENAEKEEDYIVKLHEKGVPLAFVLLWIAGLLLTIINPDFVSCFLPNAEVIDSTVKTILNGLICVYFVFVIEVFVTLLDVKLVFKINHKRKDSSKIKDATKELWATVFKSVIPTFVLAFVVLYMYGIYQRHILLSFFIVLSSLNKFYEVSLANNGEKILVNKIVPSNKLFPKSSN